MIFKANFYDERFIVGIYIHTQWLHNNFDLEAFFAGGEVLAKWKCLIKIDQFKIMIGCWIKDFHYTS